MKFFLFPGVKPLCMALLAPAQYASFYVERIDLASKLRNLD